MAALTHLVRGQIYLMPSRRLALCTAINETTVSFEYSTEEGVALNRDFAEHNLVLFGGMFKGESK